MSYEKIVEHSKAKDFEKQRVIGCPTCLKETRLRMTWPLRESLKASGRLWRLTV